MRWFRRVFTASSDELTTVVMDACDYYEKEYPMIREFVRIVDCVVDKEAKIGGIMEYAYGCLQDIQMIIDVLETLESREKLKHLKFYLEKYERQLTSSQLDKYADGEDSVYAIRMLRHLCNNIRGQFTAGTKGLEFMHFQLTNITKMSAAGLDDVMYRGLDERLKP